MCGILCMPLLLFDPADPNQTTLAIFFTRWVTHFCAPAFSFLAGMSAYMVGKKAKNELSGFLIKRGIWLIFIDLTIVGFAWFFDFQFGTINLHVIASLRNQYDCFGRIGTSPRQTILIFNLVLIFGHNLLDGIRLDESILWAIFHYQNIFFLSDDLMLLVAYPIIPWIAVMSLGYCLGAYYEKSIDPSKRRLIFTLIGVIAIVLFVGMRWTNIYGDPNAFEYFGTISKNFVSFLNPTKYPPSLMYLLMTLGGTILLLANSERWKGKVVDFICTFGRVPFFSIIHIYLSLDCNGCFDWFYLEKTWFLAAWDIENPISGLGFRFG